MSLRVFLQNIIIDGSPRWEILRSVPVLPELSTSSGDEVETPRSSGASNGMRIVPKSARTPVCARLKVVDLTPDKNESNPALL
jgi:hypothetical protein